MVQSAILRRDLHAQIQKFWNICSNLRFKEDSFYTSWNFSGKVSSEMERFKVFRNQRFSVPSTVEEAVIRQFWQSLYPWTCLLPCAAQIQILY